MADAKRRLNPFAYRIGRRFYWLLLASLLLLGFALDDLLPPSTANGMIVVWMLIYVWRLHDIGRSGWWAVVPVAVSWTVSIGALLLFRGDPSPSFLAMGLAVLIQLVFMIWLGSRRGDEGSNRFGDRTVLKIGRFAL